jgi:hypothetical protein
VYATVHVVAVMGASVDARQLTPERLPCVDGAVTVSLTAILPRVTLPVLVTTNV